jgi:hypothetical protein
MRTADKLSRGVEFGYREFPVTRTWQVRRVPGYAFDEAKHRRNEEMKEHDHAPWRAAIIATVRDGGNEGAHLPGVFHADGIGAGNCSATRCPTT